MNACASQAIINLLLNAPQDEENGGGSGEEGGSLELGKSLEDFRSFTSAFDPGVGTFHLREYSIKSMQKNI
jgi:hypothetical protein